MQRSGDTLRIESLTNPLVKELRALRPIKGRTCQADALQLAERLMHQAAPVCRMLRSGTQRIRGSLRSALDFQLRPMPSQAQRTRLPMQRFDFVVPSQVALVAPASLRGVCQPLSLQQPQPSPQRAAASPFVGLQQHPGAHRPDGSRRHVQAVGPCARALRLRRCLPA